MSTAPNIPLQQHGQPEPSPPTTWADLLASIPSPMSLVEHLDRHVVGQQAAKRKLAVAVSNHFKRLVDGERWTGRMTGLDPIADAPDLMQVVIERSNVLLIGPSGSGKTLLLKALAERLNVPVVIADATTLTETGYVGEDVESLLVKLYLASGGDFGKAQSGIIFIDEIDKLAGRTSTVRDIGGEGVQHALLKMIEGFVSFIPTKLGPRHPGDETVPLDTTGVLFICGGAFPGLEEIISSRLGRSAGGFGFGAANDERPVGEGDLLRHVLPEDLQAFGLIPEFVGRMPIIATLDDLGVEDLARILGDPKNALLKQYRKILRLQGADLDFTPDAIREIARMAHARCTGARGLRSVLEMVVEGVMYEVSEADRGHVFVIDERVVRGEGTPVRTPIRAVPPLRPLLRRRVTG
ncbi:MAG: ATP-dependent Clp protease, ATP-binding subunit ClpX [Planctomycetota bacterium]|nr:ATP-dependent Clp protease, ATP-binding subunit ClpX [Planctomycetota bacterium]